ncbi:hypothetical protein GCM10022419_003140 [Nonomuraea rosea]|uniref:Uncharacterized protein n=1 Tax=Nonomuraea rosea TaxID=638574 RepID=A0ABP6V6H3_9ACTN
MIDTPAEGRAESDGPLAGRQLDALRTTYPAWEIQHLPEGPGQARWTARLRRPITAQLRAVGVQEHVAGPDAFTLASALAHQAALLHNRRSRTWST